MPVRTGIGSAIKILGASKASISTASTANFDFGTPNDLDLAGLANYEPGDRIVAVFAATTSGTTDTVSFSIQDADDSAGSIGTPAAADTDGTLTGGTGDTYARASVNLKPDRPWIRARLTSTGATDTFAVTCTVLAVPRVL